MRSELRDVAGAGTGPTADEVRSDPTFWAVAEGWGDSALTEQAYEPTLPPAFIIADESWADEEELSSDRLANEDLARSNTSPSFDAEADERDSMESAARQLIIDTNQAYADFKSGFGEKPDYRQAYTDAAVLHMQARGVPDERIRTGALYNYFAYSEDRSAAKKLSALLERVEAEGYELPNRKSYFNYDQQVPAAHSERRRLEMREFVDSHHFGDYVEAMHYLDSGDRLGGDADPLVTPMADLTFHTEPDTPAALIAAEQAVELRDIRVARAIEGLGGLQRVCQARLGMIDLPLHPDVIMAIDRLPNGRMPTRPLPITSEPVTSGPARDVLEHIAYLERCADPSTRIDTADVLRRAGEGWQPESPDRYARATPRRSQIQALHRMTSWLSLSVFLAGRSVYSMLDSDPLTDRELDFWTSAGSA